MPQLSLLPVVSVVNGQPMALSIDVATYFNKNHRDVLRALDRIVARCHPEQLRKIAQLFLTAKVGQGAQKPIRAYQMTKDGFTFLAMGFTGPEADTFKWNYIAAFNLMAARLSSLNEAETLARGRLEAATRLVGSRAALADAALALLDEGLTQRQTAELLHVSRHTVYRLKKRFGFLAAPKAETLAQGALA